MTGANYLISLLPMQDLRKILEPLIRAAGILQTAEKIGVSDAAIHRWLGGKSAIGEEKENKLAQLFGYKVVKKIEKISLDGD